MRPCSSERMTACASASAMRMFEKWAARPTVSSAFGLMKATMSLRMIACTSEERDGSVRHGRWFRQADQSLQNTGRRAAAAKGIINVRTTDKNGKVVAIMPVNEDSDVLVMTANGKLIRVRSTDIRAVGRATQGVRLIQLG